MKKFEVNGKKYNVVPMTFNTVCELEDRGVSIEEFTKKKLGFARAYLSIAANIDLDEAGVEIEKHIASGMDLAKFFEVIAKEIEESGFFQSLTKAATEETPKSATTE